MTLVLRRSLILGMLLAVLAACGTGATETQNAAAPTATPASADNQAQVEAKLTAAPTKPKPTAAPTATVEATKEELQVEAFGFAQDKRTVAYVVKIKNPNAAFEISDLKLEVTGYAKDGSVIATDTRYFSLIYPNQILPMAGDLYLDSDSAVADRIEIELTEGTYAASTSKPLPSFTTEKVTYLNDGYRAKVTGIVPNPYSTQVDSLWMTAIAYDEAGAIIGGGWTTLGFIPANGIAAVMVPVVTQGTPAKIELHGAFSREYDLSVTTDKTGAEPISIIAEGYSQSQADRLDYGLIVKNPNPAIAYDNSLYQVAVYAEDGSVLGVAEGSLRGLLPDQELGYGGNVFIPEGATVGNVVMQVFADRPREIDPLSGFTFENTTVTTNEYSTVATGSINSPYTTEIKGIYVSAVTFDDSGAITGGSYDIVAVPAGGQTAVEVTVIVGGTPARAELYATVIDLSDLK